MSVFRGSAVAIVTPFREEDESLNFDAFADIIDYQIDHGTDAIVVCGSTGEAATMTEKEHMDTVKFCIEHVAHRVPVIAGTGSNCTKTAVDLSVLGAEYGADGLLLVSPYYNKATQEGLYLHYKAVADAVHGTPVIVYNVPGRTGCNVLPETVARMVKDVPNIVGIKEASGNISQIGKLMVLHSAGLALSPLLQTSRRRPCMICARNSLTGMWQELQRSSAISIRCLRTSSRKSTRFRSRRP